MTLPQVLIIELGSQYTLLIERTLRELGVRSVVLDPTRARQWIQQHPMKAIILSGGAASVYDKDAQEPPSEILSLRREDGAEVMLLGICFGMQWLAHRLGGEVKSVAEHREYGRAHIQYVGTGGDAVFSGPPTQEVWMSHGDTVTRIPDGFEVLAVSECAFASPTCPPAMIRKGHVWGMQFHPEVSHTLHGKEMLANFLSVAGCAHDWEPLSMVNAIQERVRVDVGSERAIIGFSGGVDSTTLAAILAPVLGDRFRAVVIDAGQFRAGEMDEIRRHALSARVNLHVIDARTRFMAALADTIDAEEKRRRFKKLYTSILVQAAEDFDATIVIQGTLAPDRIESGATGGATIKSHHNVGLDMGDLAQLHPIDDLFKYEVRALSKELGLPESVWNRQPFPGPGLFVRVLGVPVSAENLETVRWADRCVKEVLMRHGEYEGLSQLVVAFNGGKIVGVKGDARVYDGTIVVRGVKTVDFMTARGIHFSEKVTDDIEKAVTAHARVTRVWFDSTDKPPGTTEFE